MRITQISVTCTETCNLGDYSNTKPSIELHAQLDATDHPTDVISELIAIAKTYLHAEIDKELIAVSKPPKYYTGQRFDYIVSSRYKFGAVVPMGQQRMPHTYHRLANTTPDAALAEANASVEKDDLFFDCSDGDLSYLMAHIEQSEIALKQIEAERRQRQEEEQRQYDRDLQAARSRQDDDDDEDDDEEDDDE
ncbi:MAG: hypothetical protein ACTS5I_16925 [Rhodanobacter sp.]